MAKQLEILTDDHPILKQVAEPVTTFDEELKTLGEDMILTLHKSRGIGLAAPQVGVSKRIIVIRHDYPNEDFDYTVMCNPAIIEASKDKQKFKEGCLSFPGLYLDVVRHNAVRVMYTSVDGVEGKWELATGIDAVCFQHEIDHLDGKLFTSKVNPIALALARKNMRR